MTKEPADKFTSEQYKDFWPSLFFTETNWEWLEVGGTDATEFLHRMLTVEIGATPEATSQWAALCDPKGRVLSIMLMVNLSSVIWLGLPPNSREWLSHYLSRYRLRADVSLTSVAAHTYAIGGDAASDELQHEFTSFTPDKRYNPMSHGFLVRIPPNDPARYLLVDSLLDKDRFRRLIRLSCDEADKWWQLTNMLAGLPQLLPEFRGRYIPQMLDLDRLKMIDYQKGCFPGQEVIARTHYRGQVKRRLVLLSNPPDRDLHPGEKTTIRSSAIEILAHVKLGRWTLVQAMAPNPLPENLLPYLFDSHFPARDQTS